MPREYYDISIPRLFSQDESPVSVGFILMWTFVQGFTRWSVAGHISTSRPRPDKQLQEGLDQWCYVADAAQI